MLHFGQSKLVSVCSRPCRQSPGLLYRVSPVGLQKEAAASTPCSATDREAEKPLKLSVPEPLTRTIKILAKDVFFMLRV